jgi:peptide/nickel transport system permease protein
MSVTLPVTVVAPRRRSSLLQHGGLLFGGAVLALIVLAALLAPWIAPYDTAAQDLFHRRVPPVWHEWLFGGHRATWQHPLGTDKLGRDTLSRLMYGGRISLLIGVSAASVSGAIGITLGLLAGYFRGWWDLAVTFAVTTRLSMPVVLVALVVVSVYGNSLPILVAVIGLLAWDRFAVVSRSLTLQLSQREYVVSARALGCSVPHILLREILPNLAAPLMVIATLEMANAILFEAALSFLGLGVPPPLPAWGLMLAEAKEDIFFNSWMIFQPGLLLFLLVLSINMLGDGLRDLNASARR